MNTMEQKLIASGLTENTAVQYVKRVMRLNRNKTFTNLSFLRKYKEIMEYMKEEKFADSSIESYIAMIISVFQKLPSKQNDKARIEYENILNNPNDYFVKRDRSVKTEAQKESWLSKEEFDEYVNRATEKGLTASRKKKNFTTKDYNDLLNYFVISLYTLLPPRRNKEYMNMKINTEEGNRLDTKNMEMIFTDYKTATTKKKKKTDLKEYPQFVKVLKLYLKRKPESDYLLVNHEGQNFKQTNTMTRLLNKIFGGNKVSSTAIRSMYLTTKYGGEQNNEMKKDATAMGHSIQQQQTTYIKNDD